MQRARKGGFIPLESNRPKNGVENKQNKSLTGFTVVEVLIFLVISGAMFLIAFWGMRGQQDSVSFRQALNGVEQKIRESFNNVDNGYFGNIGNYTCEVSGGAVNISQNDDLTEDTGGSNSDCVFLGKTVDFIDNASAMTIKTLIGARLVSDLENEEAIQETYNIDYNVEWIGNRLYNSNTGQYDYTEVLRVRAERDRNDNLASQADLRANRTYYSEETEGTWRNVSNENLPMFCFGLGDIKGSIIVTQKDIMVNYSGEGCGE